MAEATPPQSAEATVQSMLASMFASEPQLGSDGQMHEIDKFTRIAPQQGELLCLIHRTLKPKHSLEIGCGYGFSTVYFMRAMLELTNSRHTIIDPHQISYYAGMGLEKVKALGMSDRVTFIEQESCIALGKLALEGYKAEMIFIDGRHHVDNVMVDFFMSDKICPLNGALVFDDMWMPSVQKVVRMVGENRKDYLRVDSPVPNAAIFRKIAEDDRIWNDYHDF